MNKRMNVFDAALKNSSKRDCVSLCWPTLLQRRVWRDADVCTSPQMLQDVESKAFFVRCVDMDWHVLCFISFTSSSASPFTHTSPCRSITFIRSSSGKRFYSTFQWGFGFPDETFLPRFLGFALRFRLPKEPIENIWWGTTLFKKKKKLEDDEQTLCYFFLLSSVLSFCSEIPSSSDLHQYSFLIYSVFYPFN